MPKLTKLEQENIRTIMQALHGCRKNCAECREEELAEEKYWRKLNKQNKNHEQS